MVGNPDAGKTSGCLGDRAALVRLASHLTADLRHKLLSESEAAAVVEAVAEFCRARTRKRECRRWQGGPPDCLAVALEHAERVRQLDRCTPRDRLAYWACLLVGDAERGEADVRPRRE